MPMVGFSGELQDQAGLEIQAYQTKAKFWAFSVLSCVNLKESRSSGTALLP